jgi:glycosyltransferase involved in cell wall biosynthesis
LKFGIVVPTYFRGDGRTREILSKTLESVASQDFTDYKLFLIGDDYSDAKEFREYEQLLPKEKMQSINLPVAVERRRYPQGGAKLWCSGGVNATNFGIDLALSHGYTHICHLDHDDLWTPDHLSALAEVFEQDSQAVVAFTASRYLKVYILPRVGELNGEVTGEITPAMPPPENVAHSSVCIDFSKVHLRYRDVHHEGGEPTAADLDFWIRLEAYCKERRYPGYHVAKLTCIHDDEGYARTTEVVVPNKGLFARIFGYFFRRS